MTLIEIVYLIDGLLYGGLIVWLLHINAAKKRSQYFTFQQSITFDKYSDWVVFRWMHQPNKKLDKDDHYIMATGVGEEVGEVQGLLKRWIRDGQLSREKLVKECGDVLYYLTRIMRAHNIMPSEALTENMIKVEGRLVRGTLHGSGDDR